MQLITASPALSIGPQPAPDNAAPFAAIASALQALSPFVSLREREGEREREIEFDREQEKKRQAGRKREKDEGTQKKIKENTFDEM